MELNKNLLLGILRGINLSHVQPLSEVFIKVGLKAVEVTMNTPNAPEIISAFKEHLGSKVSLGAGTVLSLKDMDAALNAGAEFIVMPSIVSDVCKFCAKNNIPFFPGALTPNEIHMAWDSGAAMVKVFPSKFFGPSYFKEIKGPFDKIKLLACGGVSDTNIGEYFANGADGAAFGGSIFNITEMNNGNYTQVETKISKLLANIPV